MPAKRTAGAPVTYFIQAVDGGPVKIGKSSWNALQARLGTLQTGYSRTLHVAGYLRGNHERELHRRWEHLHIRGEWFAPCTEMQEFAAIVVDNEDEEFSPRAEAAIRQAYIAGWKAATERLAQTLADDLSERVRVAVRDETETVGEEPDDLNFRRQLDRISAEIQSTVFPPRSHGEENGAISEAESQC